MAKILIAFFLGLGTAAALGQTEYKTSVSRPSLSCVERSKDPDISKHCIDVDSYSQLIVLNGVDPEGKMAAIRVDSVGHVICSTEGK